jgi:hypothetical protein
MENKNKSTMGISSDSLRTKGKGIIEDTTQYGEFISSFHGWKTLDEQKRIARYLEELSSEYIEKDEEIEKGD